MSSSLFAVTPRSRRSFLALGAGVGAAALLSACGTSATPTGNPVGPGSEAVRSAENARRSPTAAVRAAALRAQLTTIDLGGVQVDTWAYGSELPGREIRLRRGQVLAAQLTNALPAPTTVHWHGIALRNDMDGAPDITQPPIPAGSDFGYEFTAPDAGTYFFHPHVGVQLDRGLYAPLIVEDPEDGNDYDLEAVVVLDDWLDGISGRDPDKELTRLHEQGMSGMNMGGSAGIGHGGMSMNGSMSPSADPAMPLGADTGDVDYPYYLINGRLGTDPVVFTARPGQRMRLRIINAAGDTAFRVGVGGHRLRVTHTDGFPVIPTDTANILIGMGERYDVIVELGDGVFPLVAVAEGKTGQASALLRTSAGTPPPPGIRPTELTETPLSASALSAEDAVRLPIRPADKTLDVTLDADSSKYIWKLNGKAFPDHQALNVTQGQRVRLRLINKTMMWHPMHLHGHTFQVVTTNTAGPRKDTSIVAPMQTLEVDFDTDNPGQWMLHCHNVYHGEAGMMTVLSYQQ